MSKLVVNKESCCGCGCCEATCEAVFKLDDDGKACVKDAGKVEENKKLVQDAVNSCPTGAIELTEE